MKKAFTMIELIFVIVILGVLAAIAIPRLAATRDDAGAVKLAMNFGTLVSDIRAYHISQGGFDGVNSIDTMTNVAFGKVEKNGASELIGRLGVNGYNCLTITVLKRGHGDVKKLGGVEYLRVQKTDDGSGAKDQAVCKKTYEQPVVKEFLNATFSVEKDGKTLHPEAGGVPISESAIF